MIIHLIITFFVLVKFAAAHWVTRNGCSLLGVFNTVHCQSASYGMTYNYLVYFRSCLFICIEAKGEGSGPLDI